METILNLNLLENLSNIQQSIECENFEFDLYISFLTNRQQMSWLPNEYTPKSLHNLPPPHSKKRKKVIVINNLKDDISIIFVICLISNLLYTFDDLYYMPRKSERKEQQMEN